MKKENNKINDKERNWERRNSTNISYLEKLCASMILGMTFLACRHVAAAGRQHRTTPGNNLLESSQ